MGENTVEPNSIEINNEDIISIIGTLEIIKEIPKEAKVSSSDFESHLFHFYSFCFSFQGNL